VGNLYKLISSGTGNRHWQIFLLKAKGKAYKVMGHTKVFCGTFIFNVSQERILTNFCPGRRVEVTSGKVFD
jgi:hypothetical protein